MPSLGCVADDFTGASDAASFLAKGGMPVLLTNGVPEQEPRETEAVVIALKSRTQETRAAVADSLAALKWLEARGAKQFYIKYCSTFDSTPKGNIGPIADAAMEYLGARFTVLCPGLPANGRTVTDGRLYVNGVPLDESHMKNHPLTPMWDSRIAELMRPQSKYECLELHKEDMALSDGEIYAKIEKFAEGREHFYVIPAHETEDDGERIAELFGGLTLLTGGSGILEPLAKRRSRDGHYAPSHIHGTEGRAILLAGSCSKATLAQIKYFIDNGGRAYKVNPVAMLRGEDDIENIWRFAAEDEETPTLIYSSDTSDNVKEAQAFGQEAVASLLENTMAELAKRALEAGYKRIIVAGGETSGAVTRGLGFSAFHIGRSVAPGVPVMTPYGVPDVRLVLKSGNFGQEDFFERALKMTGKEE